MTVLVWCVVVTAQIANAFSVPFLHLHQRWDVTGESCKS